MSVRKVINVSQSNTCKMHLILLFNDRNTSFILFWKGKGGGKDLFTGSRIIRFENRADFKATRASSTVHLQTIYYIRKNGTVRQMHNPIIAKFMFSFTTKSFSNLKWIRYPYFFFNFWYIFYVWKGPTDLCCKTNGENGRYLPQYCGLSEPAI